MTPYRKAAKVVNIPSKSLNIAARFRTLHETVRDENREKRHLKNEKAHEKLKVKLDKADSRFLKKFESKHWPKVLKFLEDYVKSDTSTYIELNRLTDSLGVDSSVVKETLREKLREAGFTFKDEGYYGEKVCW